MVVNATFNNIAVLLWYLILLVEETGVLWENHWLAASFLYFRYYHPEFHLDKILARNLFPSGANMSTRRLLFQWVSTIQIQLNVLV